MTFVSLVNGWDIENVANMVCDARDFSMIFVMDIENDVQIMVLFEHLPHPARTF